MKWSASYQQVIIGWVLGVIFLILGVLNYLQIHPVPGLFYGIISLIYFPPIGRLVFRQWVLRIPFYLKVIFALLLLWATLAVGDLAELYGL